MYRLCSRFLFSQVLHQKKHRGAVGCHFFRGLVLLLCILAGWPWWTWWAHPGWRLWGWTLYFRFSCETCCKAWRYWKWAGCSSGLSALAHFCVRDVCWQPPIWHGLHRQPLCLLVKDFVALSTRTAFGLCHSLALRLLAPQSFALHELWCGFQAASRQSLLLAHPLPSKAGNFRFWLPSHTHGDTAQSSQDLCLDRP